MDILRLREDSPAADIEKLMPSFIRLLVTSVRLMMEKRGHAGSCSVFGLWLLKWDGLTSRGVKTLYSKNSSRARMLTQKLVGQGVDSAEVRDYLLRAVTRGAEFSELLNVMLEAQKKGKFNASLSVGANLLFMTRHLFLNVASDAAKEKIVDIDGLGQFWIGNRHRYTESPSIDMSGCLQFKPNFIKLKA